MKRRNNVMAKLVSFSMMLILLLTSALSVNAEDIAMVDDYGKPVVITTTNDGKNPVNIFGVNTEFVDDEGNPIWTKQADGTYMRKTLGVTVVFNPADETLTFNGKTKASYENIIFIDFPVIPKAIVYSCSKQVISGTCVAEGDACLALGFSRYGFSGFEGLTNKNVGANSAGGAYMNDNTKVPNVAEYNHLILKAWIGVKSSLTFDNFVVKFSIVEGEVRNTFGPLAQGKYSDASVTTESSDITTDGTAADTDTDTDADGTTDDMGTSGTASSDTASVTDNAGEKSGNNNVLTIVLIAVIAVLLAAVIFMAVKKNKK